MKLFNYHPDTLIFLSESEADESPLEPGEFLIPAHSTKKAPPADLALQEVAVFDLAADDWIKKIDYRNVSLFDKVSGAQLEHLDDIFTCPDTATEQPRPQLEQYQAVVFENGAWVVKPDYRGAVLYDTLAGQPASITEIGISPADKGYTDLVPPSAPSKWDGSAWVDDLDGYKADQIAALQKSYQAAIQMPVAYMDTTFQADDASQIVLTKVLVAGSVPAGFFWLDANNASVSMNYADLQGLASAILVQGQLAFAKLQQLKDQIRSAKTVKKVLAVVW